MKDKSEVSLTTINKYRVSFSHEVNDMIKAAKQRGVISACILVGMLLLTYFVFAGNAKPVQSYDLPSYAVKNPMVAEAYLFAKENPEALNRVNCHCGCMQMSHEGRLHARGLLDCFKKDNGSYDIHGSQCAMCVNDALEVKQLMNQGKSKEDIKKIIDNKYTIGT